MKSLITVGLALLFTAPVYGQDISAARELYFSASYEEALGVLSRIEPSSQSTDRLAVNQYRAFCLLALGRTSEAEQAIETVVMENPLFQPGDNDASPRLRSAFASVRSRILPAVVQQEYVAAKAAFDRQDYNVASAKFERVLQALGEPELALAAGRPPLSDVRTLATGFRELAMRAAAPPPAPEPPPAPPAPVVAAQRPANMIYTGAEVGLTPPVAIRQVMPNFPRDLVSFRAGVLEVIINEEGGVDQAVMRVSINPRFDAQVLGYAREWKYQPATMGGTPVKFRKVINISVKPNS